MCLFSEKDDGTKDRMDNWGRCLEFEISVSKMKIKLGGLIMFKPGGMGNLCTRVLEEPT